MVYSETDIIDFIGIGAEKAGSTWLADMLREHPKVFVPRKKEIYFFNEYDPHFLKVKNPKYEWGIGWYLDHFNDIDDKILKGEFSPTYLYSRKTAERIHRHFPNVKIFIVLRDPVKRAFSQYIQDKRFGLLDGLSFHKAIKENATYIEKGLYHKHVTNYLNIFPNKNIKIMILDDIKSNPKKSVSEAFEFLGLDDKGFTPKALNKKSNRAKKARFVGLNKFMISKEYALRNSQYKWILRYLEGSGIRELAIKVRELNSKNYDKYPSLDGKIKVKLYHYFENDIKDLEKLIGRKLDKWKY